METGMGRCDPGSEQPGGDGSCNQRQRLCSSRPDSRRSGQGLSSLRRGPAAHATTMLNLPSVRQEGRESVSLHSFQNRNTLIMNHFQNYGVEDESRQTPGSRVEYLERNDSTRLLPTIPSVISRRQSSPKWMSLLSNQTSWPRSLRSA